MSSKLFNQNVALVLKNAGITAAMLETNCNFPRNNGMQIGYKILHTADLPIQYALNALYGPIVQPNCEHELSEISGFGELYDSACISHCISLGEKWVNGDQRCEVGMKYPTFSPPAFIKKWNLSRVGEHQSAACKTTYEIWENPDSTMVWSCQQGHMGKGGYAGLIFNSFDKAISFVNWFLRKPSHYVKDIDMFINGLGGIDIEDYKDFQAQQVKAIQ